MPGIVDEGPGGLYVGGLFTPAPVQTSAYTAAPGDFVPCDTTSGAFTVTLPAQPADGTTVWVKMITQGGTNAVTVACGGTDTINTPTGSTSRTVSLLSQAFLFQYKLSLGVWYTADHLSLSSLDSRYTQQVATSATAPKVVALTDATTIATNAALGNDFRVTLGGNRTMGTPTNPTDGQQIIYQLTQDGTGSRTVTWNAVFDFGTPGAPTLTTTAGKTDLVRFGYNATLTKWLYFSSTLGL